MKVSNLNGNSACYPNDSIERISFPKAREVFSPDECAGNEVSPSETILHISFKDGSTATFVAKNWHITEI